eukprot:210307-Rhodomonas_salina.1
MAVTGAVARARGDPLTAPGTNAQPAYACSTRCAVLTRSMGYQEHTRYKDPVPYKVSLSQVWRLWSYA